MFKRSSGILLHPTSLPSPYGIGEIGGELYKFLDMLEEYRQRVWQVLPLGPTGYGDSPYQSFSSFAGNPLLISIDELLKNELLTPDDIDLPAFPEEYVDYGSVTRIKEEILYLAFRNFEPSADYRRFCQEQKWWLNTYATFMALKRKNNLRPWIDWDVKFHQPDTDAVENWVLEHPEEIDFEKFKQYIFEQQWNKVKQYANKRGIMIIGDIPIYVAYDSADLWGNQEIFLLDEEKRPKFVAGVPPDYFSATGQLWGNPIYNWEKIEEQGYGFWIQRISKTLKWVDAIRLDHFLGFESYWQIPYGEETAINGEWVKGPGYRLFAAVEEQLGQLPLIAEDLGVITEEVIKLRKKLGLPGMKILQHGFSHNQDSSNIHLPHNYERDFVVYTGTHDNETALQWYTDCDQEVREHFKAYSGSDGTDVVGDLIRLASGSVAVMTVFPLQDILRLPASARMNLPGTSEGNWQWRFTWEQLDSKKLEELRRFTVVYGRG